MGRNRLTGRRNSTRTWFCCLYNPRNIFARGIHLVRRRRRDQDWEDNDGALNTFSMTHPRIPGEHPSLLVDNDSDCHPLRPGIWFVLCFVMLGFHGKQVGYRCWLRFPMLGWCQKKSRYYKIVEADHMTFVINRQRGGVHFDLIYDSIFQNCRKRVFRAAPQAHAP
jgi:hypothetical protein